MDVVLVVGSALAASAWLFAAWRYADAPSESCKSKFTLRTPQLNRARSNPRRGMSLRVRDDGRHHRIKTSPRARKPVRKLHAPPAEEIVMAVVGCPDSRTLDTFLDRHYSGDDLGSRRRVIRPELTLCSSVQADAR